jgi:hypothetical protein
MKRSAGLLIALILLPIALQAQAIAYDYSSLYETVSPGIVQITTDDGSGSGFLVTSFGHIATNFHVIRNSRYLAVQFPDGRKVKADVIAVNQKYDMALLKVNSIVVKGIRPLKLLPEDREPSVRVGIPVVALGSPLNQKFLMTQGILSKVDDETVLGDFLLQAGNSGGPLLNVDGQVVGINTFGEGAISGAVRIGTLRALLMSDGIWNSASIEPSSELLPSLSNVRYPVDILNMKIETEPLDLGAYNFAAGNFSVTAVTPVLIGKIQSVSGKMRQENRYARRSKNISVPEFRGLDDPYYEWHRTTENALDFAVTFDIRPRTGFTPKNKLSALMVPLLTLGKGGKREMEFKGEFLEFRIYRDGELISPIMPGRQLVTGTSAKERPFIDEAYAGSYSYSPEEFMTGAEFRVQVVDARRPKEVHKEIVFREDSPLIQQIRSDFTYSPGFLFLKLP